jgi:hypothetical protein
MICTAQIGQVVLAVVRTIRGEYRFVAVGIHGGDGRLSIINDEAFEKDQIVQKEYKRRLRDRRRAAAAP